MDSWVGSRPAWPGRQQFECYTQSDVHNGLSGEENRLLARTPHIEQAVTLVMQGLRRLRNGFSWGRDGARRGRDDPARRRAENTRYGSRITNSAPGRNRGAIGARWGAR